MPPIPPRLDGPRSPWLRLGPSAEVAHSRDGRIDTAATWRADSKGTAEVAGTTAIPTSRLSELDVVTDSGRVLVRIPVARQVT